MNLDPNPYRFPNSNSIPRDQPLIANDSGAASLMYGLSLLKDRIHRVQSLVELLAHHEPVVVATMGSLIEDIKGTAASMMFYCQQLYLSQAPTGSSVAFNIEGTDGKSSPTRESRPGHGSSHEKIDRKSWDEFEIIELDVSELLAKYTHFCGVCGKGFKRDANLRMHMRAHGDEYKTCAALSKPVKVDDDDGAAFGKKYSCPQEGCRWNRNHPKFQPLKSMLCVKNHYKRSHCPKTYVCNRCNRKRFSVMSDLRTHEKHCGDAAEWRCTCGTTFSRKDKLMGHVSLFIGHAPAVDEGGMKRSARTIRIDEGYYW